MRIASVGHAVFASTMIVLGVVGFVKGDWVSMWQPPKSAPALAYLCAAVSLACGIGLLWRATAAAAARVLLAFLLLWLVLVRVPAMIRAFGVDTWWPASHTAVMTAAAWELYVCLAGDRDKRRFGFAAGNRGLFMSRILFGAGLIPFGISHFLYLKYTASLVPSWLPWHMAWAAFTGGAFIAAGLAVLTGVLARLAATLSAWQMGMFTLLVWAPILAAGSKSASQWSEAILSAALTAAAWVVAESYCGASWVGIVRSDNRGDKTQYAKHSRS